MCTCVYVCMCACILFIQNELQALQMCEFLQYGPGSNSGIMLVQAPGMGVVLPFHKASSTT